MESAAKKAVVFSPVRVVVLVTVVLLVFASPANLSGQQGKFVTVEVREGQSLRDIAREYLDDPDLWQQILRTNQLSSATEVKPGVKLRLARSQVTLATSMLGQLAATMREASRLGAKVFATEPLQSAVEFNNRALSRRRAGDWKGCLGLAEQGKAKAAMALAMTRQARDAAGEAVLNSLVGRAQARKPGAAVWASLARGGVLVERQRVRTLSASQAEIMFIDESRLRLGANSQAVLKRMRIDRLDNRQQADVSLLTGDVHALLGASARTRSIAVGTEGVTTETASTDFWVGREGTTTKVANYDDVELKVTSADVTVALGKNQGSLVKAGQAPTRRELLSAIELLAPGDDQVVYGREVDLAWQAVAGAVRYQVEVSSDHSFRNLVVSRAESKSGSGLMWRSATKPKLRWLAPAEAVYYWRVIAIDKLDFPGAKGEIRRMVVQKDPGAPFLAIHSPAAGAILRTEVARIVGSASSTGTLRVAGQPAELAADGAFGVEVPLAEGANSITLEVTDGATGRVSSRQLHLAYMPDRPAQIVYESGPTLAPGSFVTRRGWFALAGRTTPGARVDVRSETGDFCAGTIAGQAGEFAFSLPVAGESEPFKLLVVADSGHLTEDRFEVHRDDQPPLIRVTEEPPLTTASPTLQLRATIVDAVEASLDGRPLTLAPDGTAEQTISLEPGANRIDLVARDQVGNQALWERTVIYDRQPPALTSRRVAPTRARGGETIAVTVVASDASELVRAAPFTLKVGTWVHRGVLLLEPGTGTFRARVALPATVTGEVRLSEVILEDRNSNRKVYNLR